jgi:chaperone required for assembly of F1-ATPase
LRPAAASLPVLTPWPPAATTLATATRPKHVVDPTRSWCTSTTAPWQLAVVNADVCVFVSFFFSFALASD